MELRNDAFDRSLRATAVGLIALALVAGCTAPGDSDAAASDPPAAESATAQVAATAATSAVAEPAAADVPAADPVITIDNAFAAAAQPLMAVTKPAAKPAVKQVARRRAQPVPATSWPAGATLRRGDHGPIAMALQRRLSELRYDPGRQDGRFGIQTRQALWAFQHVNGLPATGEVDARTSRALAAPRSPAILARKPAPSRVEVNIAKQYAVVYLNSRIRLITHISSGSGKRWCETDLTGRLRCASGGTPRGTFKVHGEIHAWRTSYLGKLYKPAYFRGGYALHGSLSVPNGPASHGCVRIPMHVAEYLVNLTEIGMPVTVV